jgi:hypothetical protein
MLALIYSINTLTRGDHIRLMSGSNCLLARLPRLSQIRCHRTMPNHGILRGGAAKKAERKRQIPCFMAAGSSSGPKLIRRRPCKKNDRSATVIEDNLKMRWCAPYKMTGAGAKSALRSRAEFPTHENDDEVNSALMTPRFYYLY